MNEARDFLWALFFHHLVERTTFLESEICLAMARTIKEIENILKNSNHNLSRTFLAELHNDPRKGVQKLLKKWLKDQEGIKRQKEKYVKMSCYESELFSQNIYKIAGVDEVGRGPLAGPVVAAAVILGDSFYLPGLDDSKVISENKRDVFYQYIIEHAQSVGIGTATAQEIDELNIYHATKLAMARAVNKLEVYPEYLLVDAMEIPLPIPQKAIIKGDSKSISIAASSIIAKVTRDHYMKALAVKYPQYGFESHMGYGTSAHLHAIEAFGIIDEHRRSFAPIKQYCQFV